MPSQIVGVIEATDISWQAILDPGVSWSTQPAEEVEADLDRLAANLLEEWNNLKLRLGSF